MTEHIHPRISTYLKNVSFFLINKVKLTIIKATADPQILISAGITKYAFGNMSSYKIIVSDTPNYFAKNRDA